MSIMYRGMYYRSIAKTVMEQSNRCRGERWKAEVPGVSMRPYHAQMQMTGSVVVLQ